MKFKTIIISTEAKLTYSEGFLVIESSNPNQVYLDDVDSIIIESLHVIISTYLLNEIAKRNINLVFCDERHNPSSQLLNLYNSFNASEKLFEQIRFDSNKKKELWTSIVKQKIGMQSRLIEIIYGEKNYLKSYIDKVKYNDSTNQEAFAARKYFTYLFGNDFNRDKDCVINSALNYGYTILLSMVNRCICSYGYSTILGIKHKSNTNNFNLSCDIMEPFRTIVDMIVVQNAGRSEFDLEYKKIIIEALNGTIYYNKKEYKVENAINRFFLNSIKYLKNKLKSIGEIDFK